MDQLSVIKSNFDEAAAVLLRFVAQAQNVENIAAAAQIMSTSIAAGGKIISCGNGGSLCDAMHFAEELSGRYRNNRRALPAIAVSDPSHLTCVANDYGFEDVFSRFVEGLGNSGDVLLAISTSGNSANVIKAAEAALQKGMQVVGLTGKTGGDLAPLCTVNICVDHQGYADRVQEVHIKIIHTLIQLIETQLELS